MYIDLRSETSQIIVGDISQNNIHVHGILSLNVTQIIYNNILL